jgi:hypothetical protein
VLGVGGGGGRGFMKMSVELNFERSVSCRLPRCPLFKTLKSVFKTLPDCLQDTSKVSSRHFPTVFKTLPKCLQDTSRVSSRHFPSVFRTLPECLQDTTRPPHPTPYSPLPNSQHAAPPRRNRAGDFRELADALRRRLIHVDVALSIRGQRDRTADSSGRRRDPFAVVAVASRKSTRSLTGLKCEAHLTWHTPSRTA